MNKPAMRQTDQMSDDGLWLRRSTKGPKTTRQLLNQNAIKALFWIILTALIGIIVLSVLSALLQADLMAGLFAGIEQNPDSFAAADEALSVLGNIAAAAVGGLVGFLTRDILEKQAGEPDVEETVPLPTVRGRHAGDAAEE